MRLPSPQAQRRYDEVLARAADTVVCLDFDGVLSPIVPDPASARIHPAGPDTLVRLAGTVRGVAVVTGRPAAQAVELGDLDGVADRIGDEGVLLVLGQYGNERWSARERRVLSPPPPPGLDALREELPALLGRHGLDQVYVEHKTLAVALHTRRMPDPATAFTTLEPLLQEAADRHGLGVEPGRYVVEVRAPGVDKGQAVRALREELGAQALVFAGDDLGDVPAFEAVAALREEGAMAGLLVCSGSEEQRALVELADVVVDGPAGVMTFLDGLVEDARRGRQADDHEPPARR